MLFEAMYIRFVVYHGRKAFRATIKTNISVEESEMSSAFIIIISRLSCLLKSNLSPTSRSEFCVSHCIIMFASKLSPKGFPILEIYQKSLDPVEIIYTGNNYRESVA